MDENQDQESLEPQESQAEGEAKPRTRRKSPKNALYDSLKQIDNLLASKTIKESKAADLVIEKVAIQKVLLQIELDERHDEAIQSAESLKLQHEQDEQEISRLKAENAELRKRVSERLTETVPDLEARQEAKALRETLSVYNKAIRLVCSCISPEIKPQVAIRIIQTVPAIAARPFVQALGIDFNEYARDLQRCDDESLLKIIEQAKSEGPLVQFARAALLVVHHVNTYSNVTNAASNQSLEMTAEEKLAEAKRLTKGTWRSPFLNITALPAPAIPQEAPSQKAEIVRPVHPEELDLSMSRSSYLRYSGSGDLEY
jgi:hypothetical protein